MLFEVEVGAFAQNFAFQIYGKIFYFRQLPIQNQILEIFGRQRLLPVLVEGFRQNPKERLKPKIFIRFQVCVNVPHKL